MTVREGKSNSHAKCGWLTFTDHVIKLISQQSDACAFVLWGGFAQKKEKLIDASKHLVLCDPHPSPMSGAAFNDTTPFTKINEWLESKKRGAVDWSLSA